MPSDPPSSEPLDDDAIKVLLQYAGWTYEWNELDREWLVRPDDPNFFGAAAFFTLTDALEYMIRYNTHYKDPK